MDAKIREILEFLSDVTVGTSKDISPLMNGIFPVQNITTDGGPLDRFLDELKAYTTFKNHTSYRRERPYGFIGLNIALTNGGLIELKKEQDRIKQGEVNQYSIDLSKSIIATNNAIQTTNNRMLEHAEKQEAIMSAQSGFSEQQVTFTERQVKLIEQQVILVSTQNKLYRNTLILAGINILIGLIILVVTINSNSDKLSIVSLRSQLTDQRKEIQRLQLLKSDTVHYVLHYPLLKSNLKDK